jgi:hypothetical protein
MYDVTVQVTAYVRASSIVGAAEKPKAGPEDARLQAIASGLAASGFTPEEIAALLVQIKKAKGK